VRRLAIALAAAAAALGVLGAASRPAGALAGVASASSGSSTPCAARQPVVDIAQVSGLFDEVVLDQIRQSVTNAERSCAQALIIQLSTSGAVVPRSEIAALARRLAAADVAVAIWVGPSGSHALGTPGQLLGVANVVAVAPGTRVGNFGDPLDLGGITPQLGDRADLLRSATLSAQEAVASGLTRTPLADPTVPALKSMILAVDGADFHGTTLRTAQEVTTPAGKKQVELAVTPRFTKLGLVPRLMHTVASPPVAYLLLTIGMGLLVFEFFTAGVGVAGLVGAIALALGCFGVAALPTRGWAFALLVLSMIAFSVDVQTAVPRFWTAVGVLLFTVGSLGLYRGLTISWITLLVAFAGVLLTFLSGMPSMVRTRFATPTIGREWMIGELGDAVTAVAPEGIVQVGAGQWRARTNRATPVELGGRVRVVAIDGITLEVEPEAGGARDHRERARSAT
jgi:membrane-bound serine protease (ClpP class)